MFLTLSFSKRQSSPESNKKAVAICWMLITFLQEVICVISGWLQNYFNTIQTPNTSENKYVMRYNVRILLFYKHIAFYNKQEQPKDNHEGECKNEAIGSTGFTFLSTSTSKGGVFGNSSRTGLSTSSSLIGQKPTAGSGATGVERFIA